MNENLFSYQPMEQVGDEHEGKHEGKHKEKILGGLFSALRGRGH